MKKLIFLALIMSIVFLSVGAISASEINGSDSISSQDFSDNGLSTVNGGVESGSSNYLSINNVDSNLTDNSNALSANGVKKAVSIDAPHVDLYYRNGTKFIATLSDIDGNLLNNQSVIFSISGVNYTRVTDDSGVASIAINLNPGNHNIIVYYNGNEEYLDSKTTSTVTVLSTVGGNDIIKYYKNGTQYYAKFLDGSGKPLANTNITYNINGVMYTRTTNASGVSRLNINLDPNTYTLTAINPNDGCMASNTVEVLPTVFAEDLTKVYRDGNQYYAKFLDSSGKPLANTNIMYNINGVMYTRTTNASGFARLNINLDPNTYILTAINPNDGCMDSGIVKVLGSSSTYLDVNNYEYGVRDNKTITVALYNELGYTIPNQIVSVSVNGKSYNLNTSSNGVGSVNVILDSGNYTVNYAFAGTNLYKASSNSSTISIRQSKDISYIASDAVIYYGNHEAFYVTVLSNNQPVVNESLYLTINGVTYSRLTNGSGVARLAINLNPGVYDISYEIRNLDYRQLTQSNMITVIDTNVSKSSGVDTVISKGMGQKFNVALTCGNVPLVNRSVILNVNGVNYTRVTDASGIAALTINLDAGNYTIKYYYAGEDRILSSSGQALITVKERIPTSIVWNTVTSFSTENPSNLTVLLRDNNGAPLSKKVVFTIGSKSYTANTNNKGIAYVNLRLTSASYTVNYAFEGDVDYLSSEGSTIITVSQVGLNGFGYWVQGRDMKNVNLAELASLGTGEIFLNSYAFTLYGESNVLSWINTANSYGINVHIWMQTFYDGGWISPMSGGSINRALFNSLINEAKYYAGLNGVAGVHLDYLRFAGNAYATSGGTAAITQFVKEVTEAIDSVNPGCIVSAAVMPETSGDAYYYGQDIPAITKYLDVIVPMQYKGNYNSGTSWLTSTTKWFVQHSSGAQVWSGLQSYRSDSNVAPLSYNELFNDAQTVMNAGASGVILFRWGLTPYLDFSSFNNPSYGDSVEIHDILDGAIYLKNWIESNGTLPDLIDVDGVYYSNSQFLYLMSEALISINNESYSDITAIEVNSPVNSSGDVIYDQLPNSEFLKIASAICDYCNSSKCAPNNISSSIGAIKYETLVYAYSRILTFYHNNGYLPAFVYVDNFLDNYSLTVSMLPSNTNQYYYINYTTTWLNFCPKCGYYGTLLINPKKVYEGELTCAFCDSDYCGVSGNDKLSESDYALTRLSDSVPTEAGDVGGSIALSDILTASVDLKNYIETNSKLPKEVALSSGGFTLAEFLYLMSKAIVNINNGNLSDISSLDVNNPASPTGDVIDAYLSKVDYVDVANRVANFIVGYSQAPNYASSTLGKISYNELVDSFSRILDYYVENDGSLPSSVHIVYSGGSSSSSISELANSLIEGLTSTRDKAVALYNYVRDSISYSFYYNTQKGAQGTLTSGSGNCCDQAQLLVAMARSVGLTVRFATGTCTFSSGTYGHVWVQFNIDGTWINADPTSNRNSFGVINNWNTNSYYSKGTYDVLPY